MTDVFSTLPPGTVATVGGGAMGVVALLAYQFQRFMNRHKADKIDGNLLDQLTAKFNAQHLINVAQDEKIEAQDEKIHGFAIRITKLTVLVIRLEGLLVVHNIEVPEDLKADITDLKKGYK